MMLQRYANGRMSDPLSVVENMRRQLDWVFGPDPFSGSFAGRPFSVGPRFETEKTEAGGVVLTAELPGIKAEDLDVKVENGTLTISGRRTTDAPEGYEAVRKERVEINFTRAFSLGEEFDTNRIEAQLKDGIFTLTLNRRPEAQPKVIDVKAS